MCPKVFEMIQIICSNVILNILEILRNGQGTVCVKIDDFAGELASSPCENSKLMKLRLIDLVQKGAGTGFES